MDPSRYYIHTMTVSRSEPVHGDAAGSHLNATPLVVIATNVPCRLVVKKQVEDTNDGMKSVAEQKVLCASTVAVQENDELALNDGDSIRTMRVKTKRRRRMVANDTNLQLMCSEVA